MRPPVTPAPITGLAASTPVFLAVGLIVLGVFAALAARTAPHPERTALVSRSLDTRFSPNGVTPERTPGDDADLTLRRLAESAGLPLSAAGGRPGLVLPPDAIFLTGTTAVSPDGEARLRAIAVTPVWEGWAAVIDAPADQAEAAAALRDRLATLGLETAALRVAAGTADGIALRIIPAGALP